MLPYRGDYLPEMAGHHVYWAEYGNPAGVPLLLVHGGFGHMFDIDRLTGLDFVNSRIVVPHQRGMGHSQPPGKLEANTTAGNIADIERLRVTLGIPSWDILAWSSGTVFAAAHAFENPGRCKSLVSYAPYFGSNEDYMLLFETDPDTATKYFDHHHASTGYDIVKNVHKQAQGGFAESFQAYAAAQTVYDPGFDAEAALRSKTREEWNTLFANRRIGAQLDEELFTKHDRLLQGMAEMARNQPEFPVILVYGADDMWEMPHSYGQTVFPHAQTIVVRDATHDVHGAAVQQALRPILDRRATNAPSGSMGSKLREQLDLPANQKRATETRYE